MMANDKFILKNFDDLVSTLNETQGTNAKLELLARHPDLKPLIQRIWDPETKTGVTKKGLEDFFKKDKKDIQDIKPPSLYDLFDQLCQKKLTGDRAKATCERYIQKYPEYQDLILRILEKKPRIRMSSTLLLKAFPGIFRVFKVALAEDYCPKTAKDRAQFAKELEAAGKAFMSKKIDGVRLISIVRAGRIRFYSRAGHEWTSLDKLRKDFETHILPEMTDEELEHTVFDGELVALDARGQEDFSETVSQSRKKDVQMTNPRYKVFDMLSGKAFEGLEQSPKLSERLEKLRDVFQDARPEHCEVLEQKLYSPEAFERLAEQARREKWEGIMIRFDQPYEGKRSYRLMKYKFFQTEEFRVEDVVIEDMPFANEKGGETMKRALRNVIIRFKGEPVSVGSGFDAAERLDFAAHPEKIKGKLISVQYQDESIDKKTGKPSLRIPVYKALIGDERDF